MQYTDIVVILTTSTEATERESNMALVSGTNNPKLAIGRYSIAKKAWKKALLSGEDKAVVDKLEAEKWRAKEEWQKEIQQRKQEG